MHLLKIRVYVLLNKFLVEFQDRGYIHFLESFHKRTLQEQLSNISREMETLGEIPEEMLDTHVHSRIIHSSQKLEATQVFIDG